MTIKDALEVITKALIEDEGYRRGWQANIAMAFQDEYSRGHARGDTIHKISNKAATYFISLLCTSGEGKKFRMLKDLYETGPEPVSDREVKK